MFCTKCGAQNSDDSLKCGNPLKTIIDSSGSDPIVRIVPYKNTKTLISCIGSPFGIVAFIPVQQILKEA